MAEQMQKQENDSPHRDEPKHPLPLWVRWFIVLFVLLVVIAITILWIIQGVHAIVPIAVLTAFGTLLAFSQTFPLLFPGIRHEHSPALSPQPPLGSQQISSPSSQYPNKLKVDWGEAPHMGQFYGREQELGELKQWVADDRCRLIALVGMGGVGKTSLAAKLVEEIEEEFKFIFWRELKNAPPLEDIVKSCIHFLSDQQQIDVPEHVDGQIALLIQYLRDHRCLLVLDNIETILDSSNSTSQFREGYQGFGRLLQRIGEAHHLSCLMVTSREKPKEIAHLAGKTSPIRTLSLSGLKLAEGREFLQDQGLFGSDETWINLITIYSGNPLALKLVSEPIREVFGGDIAGFLKAGEAVFGDIYELLEQQFNRLSGPEQEVMYWLAVEREGIVLDDLRENILTAPSNKELFEALSSLRRRSMIEMNSARYLTLQPVIMEYVMERFIEHVNREIDSEVLKLLESHALMKAQAKDYIRNSQVRLILRPIAEHLLSVYGKEGSEKKFKRMLSKLQRTRPHTSSYTAGNILNLLVHLQCDLRSYNFSHLAILHAYLQGVALPGVNFAHARVAKSVFTETFGMLLSVAFSPGGEFLAAGTADGEIRLWQASSGTPLLTCQGHSDWVWSVTFSPDGKTLVSGSQDQTIRLWDVTTGQCLKVLHGHSSWIRSVAFSPDGKILASGNEDQSVRLWDVATSQCLNILSGHNNFVRSVAFSADGSQLASGSEDQTIRLWDVASGQCLKVLQGHTGRICSIAFSENSLLASAGHDQMIRIWNTTTGQCLRILQGHTNWIYSVAFSPDGSLLASCGVDQTIRLWNTATGQCLSVLQGHSNRVRSTTFNADGKLLASGSEDQTIRVWDIETSQCLKTLQGHTNQVWSVAFSPDGKTLASGCHDHAIRVWNIVTGYCLRTLREHSKKVWSVAFSPDGSLLASGSDDQIIRLWNVDEGQCIKTLQGHTNWVWSVAFSPDGSLLASGGHDQTIRLWDIRPGQCIRILHGHTHQVWSVAFSTNGTTLASGSEDQTVRLWNITTGESLGVLQGHTSRVYCVAFSPDGTTLASGSEDQTICLWDVATGQCLNTLRGHENRVRSVCFSVEANLLASGSEDQTVRLWDIATGQCLKVLPGHSQRVWSVAFSSFGNMLASGSEDQTIRLWNVQEGKCLKVLRSERPYEGMNITGAEGFTAAQKSTLKALGAIEN